MLRSELCSSILPRRRVGKEDEDPSERSTRWRVRQPRLGRERNTGSAVLPRVGVRSKQLETGVDVATNY